MNNKTEENCGRVIIIQNEFKIKRLKNSFKCILQFESALKVFMQPLKWFYVHNNTKNSRTITLFILPSFRLYVSTSFEIHHIIRVLFFSTWIRAGEVVKIKKKWIYVFNNISKLISRWTLNMLWYYPIYWYWSINKAVEGSLPCGLVVWA